MASRKRTIVILSAVALLLIGGAGLTAARFQAAKQRQEAARRAEENTRLATQEREEAARREADAQDEQAAGEARRVLARTDTYDFWPGPPDRWRAAQIEVATSLKRTPDEQRSSLEKGLAKVEA